MDETDLITSLESLRRKRRFTPLHLRLADIPPQPCPHVAEPVHIAGVPAAIENMTVWVCAHCGTAWLISPAATAKLTSDNWNALTRTEQRLVRTVAFGVVCRRKKYEKQYAGASTDRTPDPESVF